MSSRSVDCPTLPRCEAARRPKKKYCMNDSETNRLAGVKQGQVGAQAMQVNEPFFPVRVCVNARRSTSRPELRQVNIERYRQHKTVSGSQGLRVSGSQGLRVSGSGSQGLRVSGFPDSRFQQPARPDICNTAAYMITSAVSALDCSSVMDALACICTTPPSCCFIHCLSYPALRSQLGSRSPEQHNRSILRNS